MALQKSQNNNPVAVEFKLSGRNLVRVELSNVAAFHKENGGWAEKVYFRNDDGSEWFSYGKSWVDSDTGEITRIGAGAYGDMTVWNR